ncbi:MAG: DUF4874 domain-containing protein [Oscillospiraceae bacterium]|jgi:hypothetical protein|nr:DUF4874 domain-containing protein [Oscillospiraceae bacterium]
MKKNIPGFASTILLCAAYVWGLVEYVVWRSAALFVFSVAAVLLCAWATAFFARRALDKTAKASALFAAGFAVLQAGVALWVGCVLCHNVLEISYEVTVAVSALLSAALTVGLWVLSAKGTSKGFKASLAVLLAVFLGGAAFWWLLWFPQAPAYAGESYPQVKANIQIADAPAVTSAAPLTEEQKHALLQNPDRGFRMETYFTLGREPMVAYPSETEDPWEKLDHFIEKYQPESPQVIQLYIYLSNYREKPLDDLAFAQLKQILEYLDSRSIRALLRFAYQTEREELPDAAWSVVKGHLDQIGAFYQDNAKLVADSIYAMQMGFLGKWGELHSFINMKEKDLLPLFNKVMSVTPKNLYVTIRYTEYMSYIKPGYRYRLGIHDDTITGLPKVHWSSFRYNEPDNKAKWEKTFSRTVNDMEMPWDWEKIYGAWEDGAQDFIVPGYENEPDERGYYYYASAKSPWEPVLEMFKVYHPMTYSLEHNWRESDPAYGAMLGWLDETVTADWLTEHGLPYNARLFAEGGMNPFAYLQYHLGYLLTLSEKTADDGKVTFSIRNDGLAAPLTMQSMTIEADGKTYSVENWKPMDLQGGKELTFTIPIPGIADGTDFSVVLSPYAGCKYAVNCILGE